jgi:hypothetical protein
VSINILIFDLTSLNLPALVNECLTPHRLAPDHLILEITESTVMRDLLNVIDILQRLRSVGMQLAIDVWDLLRAHRCDYTQGFLISKPLPSTEFVAWIKQVRELPPAWGGSAAPGLSRTGRMTSPARNLFKHACSSAACLIVLITASLTIVATAHTDGRLLATALQIEGVAGGGPVPWAVIVGYGMRDEYDGPSPSCAPIRATSPRACSGSHLAFTTAGRSA